MQGSRGAGEQGSRGAGEQGSRGAGVQGSRGAGVQGSRGAGEQGCVQINLFTKTVYDYIYHMHSAPLQKRCNQGSPL